MPWVDAVTLDLLRDLAKAANDRADAAEGRLATMAQSMAERAAERPPEPKAAVVQGMAPSAEQRATKAISDASITRAVDELVNKFGIVEGRGGPGSAAVVRRAGLDRYLRHQYDGAGIRQCRGRRVRSDIDGSDMNWWRWFLDLLFWRH